MFYKCFMHIKMTTNQYQNHKEKPRKEPEKEIKSFSRRNKKKVKKGLKQMSKSAWRKKKKKNVSIIMNVIRIFLRNKSKSKLSIWEIIISHIKKTFQLLNKILLILGQLKNIYWISLSGTSGVIFLLCLMKSFSLF